MDSGSPALPSLPIRAVHTFTNVTGQGSSRLHLGDNHYKIDVHSTEQPEFTGHYSSTALRKVASYVPRPALHAQVKERLHDTLEERGYSCKILVVCGLGGAGKSQLMLNYIEVFKDDYTAVFWIDAGSKDRLEADYRRIHNLLLHPSRDDVDISTCVSEIRQWCQRKTGRYLFVLDSADSIEDEDSDGYIDLQSYVMDAASADVVITTRVQSAGDMTELEAVVQVAELTPDEARDIFIRRMNLQNPSLEIHSEIDAVTAELGHFALAVSLAAAYVASTRRLKAHPANYLIEYAERRKTLLARKPKKHIDQYGESVLTTWETTYAAIFARCPEACNLLTLIAFLSSSNIFPELFSSNYKIASGILASVIWVQTSTMSLQETIDTSVETLELYSLLQWNDQNVAFSMHKLVHTWSIERLDTAQQAMFCLAAWHYLEYLFPVTSTIPAMSERLASHITACSVKVRALCQSCQSEDLAIMPFVDSAYRLASFLHFVGRMEHAYELRLFANEYHKARRCIDPMAYAESLYALASFSIAQHKYQDAEEFVKQVLDELKEPLDDRGDRLYKRCRYMLATILTHLHGNFDEAEQVFRQILSSPFNTGDISRRRVLSRLVSVLKMQHRYDEAEEILTDLLNGPKLIPERDRVSLSRSLGQTLRRQGKYAEAEVVARNVSEDVRAHGTADIRSQIASLALGEVKLAQKEYEEAATILKNACDAITTPYNKIHLECRQVMGRVLGRLKRYEEGISFYARALDGFTQMFGTDHELSQQCSTNLDKLRAHLAERTRTETVEQQREREKNHGADHPEESSNGRTGSEEGS